MSVANERQEGGDHYKNGSGYEVWDFIIRALNNRSLEGNITKYVMRFNAKNGLEDLKKSRHYLDKLKESYGLGLIRPMLRFHESHDTALSEYELLADGYPRQMEVVGDIVLTLATWTNIEDLNQIEYDIDDLIHMKTKEKEAE